jgi:hypothetical protein
MGRTSNFIVGALVGTAVGLAVSYIFGPATDTTYDARYRSRWDKALDDGRSAADAREAELRGQFEQGKLPKSQLP